MSVPIIWGAQLSQPSPTPTPTATPISERVVSPSPGQLVILFELDPTAIYAGSTILRFTSTAYGNEAVEFGGFTYSPIEIEATGFETASDGPAATPTLKISNVSQLASAAVIGFSDLLGAKLTRIRTFKDFLDNGPTPDPSARFADDIFFVERKTTQNKLFIEWELSSKMDQEGKMLPGRQILKDTCFRTYRVWNPQTLAFDYTDATCPYVGSAYFDMLGNAVVDPSKDRANKKLQSCCEVRFGKNAVLPFQGFPGIQRF